jgi:hypothetical protein
MITNGQSENLKTHAVLFPIYSMPNAKITALTLVQFINKFIFERPINNIKTQII